MAHVLRPIQPFDNKIIVSLNSDIAVMSIYQVVSGLAYF
ncbi:hypothetical protein ACVW2L_001003 [Mucilaginibacter sp. HD30]